MMYKKLLFFFFALLIPSSAFADPLPPGHSGIKPISEIPYFPSPTRSGWEERTPEFRKWLMTGVRIGGGSGTMIHYDYKENWMYIISCGHLFQPGKRTAESLRKSPMNVVIEVFYHNNQKLEHPEQYTAQVLCYVWQNDIHDVSLMRFRPRWKDPKVSPIVPKNFKGDAYYHSIGCDGRSEVAHYLVKSHTRRTASGVVEIITTENSPRGGRSGGGLLNDKGQLLGICSRAGGGFGYFSDWTQIHDFVTEEGYGFILKSHRLFPIVDRNNPQGIYEDEYHAFPQNR